VLTTGRVRVALGATAVFALVVMLAGPVSAAPRQVSIQDFDYHPPAFVADMGVTVRWTNDDFTTHTATADDPLPNGKRGIRVFDSGNLDPGASYSKRLPWAATFAYHCTLHFGMDGRLSTRPTLTDASTGDTVRYRVTWAVADPPAGVRFDVQIRRPGKQFAAWFRGTGRSRLLRPARSGTFAFRARLVKVDGSTVKASTLFSPVVSVTVALPRSG
jgi:plastocyanin